MEHMLFSIDSSTDSLISHISFSSYVVWARICATRLLLFFFRVCVVVVAAAAFSVFCFDCFEVTRTRSARCCSLFFHISHQSPSLSTSTNWKVARWWLLTFITNKWYQMHINHLFINWWHILKLKNEHDGLQLIWQHLIFHFDTDTRHHVTHSIESLQMGQRKTHGKILWWRSGSILSRSARYKSIQ